MSEEIGTVKNVDGITARVVIEKRGSCDSCCATCESTSEGLEMEALNPIGAKVGQRVKIMMKPHSYLRGVLMVYGIPMVLFILAAVIGKHLGELYFKAYNSDLISALAAFSTLLITYIAIKFLSLRTHSKKAEHPVIDEILEDENPVFR